jgi:hypothetical protein
MHRNQIDSLRILSNRRKRLAHTINNGFVIWLSKDRRARNKRIGPRLCGGGNVGRPHAAIDLKSYIKP